MADSVLIDFTTGQGSQGLAALNDLVSFEQYVDCSVQNLANESYALFDIPEGHIHLATTIEILTIEDSAAALELGITGGDTDAFLASFDLTSTAGTILSSTASAHGSAGATGGYVTPDGGITMSMLVSAACDTAKFRIKAHFLDGRGTSVTMGARA